MTSMRASRLSTRQAFTILEIILVMGMIVIISALTIPLAQTMIVDARMSAAGDMVRARIADARGYAMEQGRPWRIGYLPKSGVIQLAPDDAPDWNNEEKDPVKKANLMRDHLPKDVVFTTNENAPSSLQGAGSGGSKWETLGVYLADGSARDDATVYFGPPGLAPMRVRVRGLTGSVSVDTLVDVKENQQP